MSDLRKIEPEEAAEFLPQAFKVREACSSREMTVEIDFNQASSEEYVARISLPGGLRFLVDRDALISALSQRPLKRSRTYASGF